MAENSDNLNPEDIAKEEAAFNFSKNKVSSRKTDFGLVRERILEEEMQESYLDYAMSVIVARALPDVRDGLKPVHRRVLYAMWETGLRANAKYRKCAAVVGEVLKSYHPHGDIAVYDTLVRMAQDFNMRFPLVDGQGNFGCFTKDTKIRLTDGRSLSFKYLIDETKNGQEHFTYTLNSETQGLEIAKIQNPRLTKKNQLIVKIGLDNGENIKCTLNHLFMLRDGTYKEAKDLKPYDSLMPLYTEAYDGHDEPLLKDYERIYQPQLDRWDFAHRLADEWNLKNHIYNESAGKIRHHLDFNKLNNNPDNIQRIPWEKHWQFHKEIASSRHNDPDYVEKLTQGRKKYWSSKENRELSSLRLSERNKIFWKDLKYREKQIAKLQKMWKNPEYKEFMSQVARENLKKLWSKQSFRKMMGQLKSAELLQRWQTREYRRYWQNKMKEISQKIWSDPKHREYISKIMKEKYQDPKWRKQQSRASKALWQDPAYRKKFSKEHFQKMAQKLWADPAVHDLHSKKAIKQWQDIEFSKKIIRAVRVSNKKRLEENPNLMRQLTDKAKIALHKNWQKPSYKNQVIKNRILSYVNSLLESHPKVTIDIYESKRINNGTPRIEKSLEYFGSFDRIIRQAERRNHKVISVEFLQKKEDVYDLTIDKTHNFALAAGVFVHNSMDGDSAAAMRYTESRMSPVAEELLFDIEKDTVDFVPNYDGTSQEPKVFPGKLPNLLLNGSMGIAVGMATNIPPHNLGEVSDAIVYLIENPDCTIEDLMEFVKGPDFPTGAEIYGREQIKTAYVTGKGAIVMRAVAKIEETKRGFKIVVSEIPYQVNKAELITKIAELIKDKKIDGITELRDESDRKEKVRIVMELRSNAYPKKVLNRLYELTAMQSSFYTNMLALVQGIQPRVLTLKNILEEYLHHRRIVVRRRAEFNLKKARERAHILEGLRIALKSIDEVVSTIRKSKNQKEAAKLLKTKFKLEEMQVNAILEMRLASLAALEREKIEIEYQEKLKLIKTLEETLSSEEKILEIIKKELRELKEKYSSVRRTKIYAETLGKFSAEDLIPAEQVIILLTRGNYIKRMPVETYHSQIRGGKGVMGMETKEEDMIEHLVIANTHDDIYFFTDRGRIFHTKVYEIPQVSRIAKGSSVVNILQISPEEKVTAMITLTAKDLEKSKYILLATSKGLVKKTALSLYLKVRKTGMVAIKIRDDDRLRWVKLTSGEDLVFQVSALGQAILYHESDIRPTGRTAAGVRGILLKSNNYVVSTDILPPGFETKTDVLVVLEKGFGKRTSLKFFKIQLRGGLGMRVANVTNRTGPIVGMKLVVGQDYDLILASLKGQMIRTALSSVKILQRDTQGVTLMRLNSGDKVTSVTVISKVPHPKLEIPSPAIEELEVPDWAKVHQDLPPKIEEAKKEKPSDEANYWGKRLD